MKYYKVKEIADNLPLKTKNWYLVANELFTVKQFNKVNLANEQLNKFNYVELIELSSHKTYRFFGCRFQATWE